MKTYIAILITIILLIGSTSPALAAAKARGDFGLGNVNQNFVGVEIPPPWDLPPGLLH